MPAISVNIAGPFPGPALGWPNGERVRIAFTLDCCDREAISWVATTGGSRSGVAGISACRTSSLATALTVALITAAKAGSYPLRRGAHAEPV